MKALIGSLVASICLLPVISGCSDKTTSDTPGGGALSGHLYWVSSAYTEVHKLDLATGEDVVLGMGHAVDRAPDGKLVIIGKTGIEESDERLLSTRVIKKSDTSNVEDDAEVNQTVPKVSPDGKHIAYQTLGDSSYVCDRDDGKVTARFMQEGATDGFLNPSWTPDGRLVMAGGFANEGLYLTDEDLKTTTRIDPDLEQPKQPAVSPDGTKVAFVLKNLVFVIGLDGEDLTQIDPTTDSADDTFPTWSPDGKYIAHYAKAGHLMVRPAEGGDGIDLFDVYPELSDKLLVMSSTVPMQWTE